MGGGVFLYSDEYVYIIYGTQTFKKKLFPSCYYNVVSLQYIIIIYRQTTDSRTLAVPRGLEALKDISCHGALTFVHVCVCAGGKYHDVILQMTSLMRTVNVIVYQIDVIVSEAGVGEGMNEGYVV